MAPSVTLFLSLMFSSSAVGYGGSFRRLKQVAAEGSSLVLLAFCNVNQGSSAQAPPGHTVTPRNNTIWHECFKPHYLRVACCCQ